MVGRALVLFFGLMISAGLVARADRREPVPSRQKLEQFPMTMDGWQGAKELPFTKNVLDALGVDDYITRVYFNPQREGVGLYIGYYQSQRQGDTMHSPLSCLPGAGWEPMSKSDLQLSVASRPGGPARDININRYLIQKGIEKQLVLYWYHAHDRVVASEYWGKIYTVVDAMRMNRTDAAMVRVISPISARDLQAETASEHSAVQFVQAVFPSLSRHLPD